MYNLCLGIIFYLKILKWKLFTDCFYICRRREHIPDDRKLHIFINLHICMEIIFNLKHAVLSVIVGTHTDFSFSHRDAVIQDHAFICFFARDHSCKFPALIQILHRYAGLLRQIDYKQVHLSFNIYSPIYNLCLDAIEGHPAPKHPTDVWFIGSDLEIFFYLQYIFYRCHIICKWNLLIPAFDSRSV